MALTNSGRWVARHTAPTLGDPFDDVVTVEDVGVNKPDPQVFAFYGYGLDGWLHVAQSQYHDIAAARRLGFAPCWIERRAGQGSPGATPEPGVVATPDLHFTKLIDLDEALRRDDR